MALPAHVFQITLKELLQIVQALIERDGENAPVAAIVLSKLDALEAASELDPAEVLEAVAVDSKLEEQQIEALNAVIASIRAA